jgi:hypothetical protein
MGGNRVPYPTTHTNGNNQCRSNNNHKPPRLLLASHLVPLLCTFAGGFEAVGFWSAKPFVHGRLLSPETAIIC